MQRGFYNLHHGGPTDQALPVTVQRITHLGDQTRTPANQNVELGATTETTNAHTRLQEMREYQERHSTLEERVITIEARTVVA